MSKLIPTVKAATRQEFMKKRSFPFLILLLPEEEEDNEWTFNTTSMPAKRVLAKAEGKDEPPEEETVTDLDRYRYFALVKNEDNPWVGRISVGRARNNDIVLPHASVSKLHAHFNLPTSEGGAMFITDAGSRNGTRVNDEVLPADGTAPVEIRDEITFGAVTLTLLDAGMLYDMVLARLG